MQTPLRFCSTFVVQQSGSGHQSAWQTKQPLIFVLADYQPLNEMFVLRIKLLYTCEQNCADDGASTHMADFSNPRCF